MRGRDLLDLIEAWPIAGLGADTLTAMLRKLPPRLYSIASSQAAVEDEVHMTIAAVRYESNGQSAKALPRHGSRIASRKMRPCPSTSTRTRTSSCRRTMTRPLS